MIGICHQLLGLDQSLEAVKHIAEQVITGNNGGRQDRRFGNPLVAGSSRARPTSEAIFKITGAQPTFIRRS
jgi:hypothetical protein